MLEKVHSPRLIVYRLLLCLLTVVCGLWTLCYAQPVSSSELINNAKFYDAKTVVYAGEVIGDVMLRQDYAWVNINDGKNALGVWMESSLAGQISYTGSYKARGDVVEITGVFHRACPQHGGDLDIHAQALRKISPGRYIQERANPDKKNLAAILLGVLLLVWILTLLKRR